MPPPPAARIVFDGPDFVLVDKPPGLLVHPTRPDGVHTLWHDLKRWLAFELANGGAVSILTRLDRETSGLVLVATTPTAARRLGRAMMRHELGKTYLAVVRGHPEADAFSIDAPLLRAADVGPSAVFVRQIAHPDGRAARTWVRVLDRRLHPEAGPVSLVEARPLTGRMHQIRVHLAHAGHALIGDKVYTSQDGAEYLEFIESGWSPALQKSLGHWRHALHCSGLAWELRAHSLPLAPDLREWWEACVHSRLNGVISF